MRQATARIGALHFALAVASPAVAQSTSDRQWMWHMNWGWSHAIYGTLMMLAFWGGLVVLVVFLVRWLGAGNSLRQEPPPPRRTPLEILQERFAKGEIDKHEFEESKRILKDSG